MLTTELSDQPLHPNNFIGGNNHRYPYRPAQYRSQYTSQQQSEIPQPEPDYSQHIDYLKTEIHKPYDLPPLPHKVAMTTASYWGAWIVADIKESWQDFCENAFTPQKLFWATVAMSVAIIAIPPVLKAVAVEPPHQELGQ